MSFSDFLERNPPEFNIQYDNEQVKSILEQQSLSVADLPALLSNNASAFLAAMARRSQQETIQRFGPTIQLFMPLYLSNLCTNICTYCGFSAHSKIKRTWLRPQQILDETTAIKNKGVQHLLLVTGEAEHKIGLDYFKHTLELIRPKFAHIQLEAQPLTREEYSTLGNNGLDGVVVYQETYDREKYQAAHPLGKKSDIVWRLNTPDRVAQAGIEKMGLGILLGLADWRKDAMTLAIHLNYLQKHYWQHKFSISFPRLRSSASDYSPPHPVDDKTLIQLILAFRLCFPDIDIVLSTRESSILRNALLSCGITHMSAESSTQPGGYSNSSTRQLEQFSTEDQRSLDDLRREIIRQEYQPLLADQIPLINI